MPDYLYRRPTSTALSPWAHTVPTPPPPPTPDEPQAACVQFVSQPRFQTFSTHAAWRFFSVKSGGGDEPEADQRPLLPAAAPGPRRTANAAYAGTFPQFVVADAT